MTARPRRYLEKIDGFNVAYAWLLSLRYNVYAWKLRLPAALAGRFGQMHAAELLDRDEWLLQIDACFDHWKARVLPHLAARYRIAFEHCGHRVDFSRMLWEMLGTRYEQDRLFVALAQRHEELDPAPGSEIAASWIVSTMDAAIAEPGGRRLPVRERRANLFLEYCGELALSAGYAGYAAVNWLRTLLRHRPALRRKPVFWAGISLTEIPIADDRLDFSWVVKHGPLAREQVLFFLPRRANAEQREDLTHQRIDYLEPQTLFAPLARMTGLRVLAHAFASLLCAVFASTRLAWVLVARILPRTLVWLELAKRYGARAHFSTPSAGWPEGLEIPAMNALGVKTVIWAYSANILGFARRAETLRDVGVRRSLFCADELWVWNRSAQDWMERRRAEPPAGRTVVRTVGAMMCGNERHLELTPGEARARIGLPQDGFFIGVFDVAAVSPERQRRFSRPPPMIPIAYSEAFFAGIARLLEAIPALRVIVKLKRALADRMRSHPATLLALLDESERRYAGRLFVLDPQIDPFLPIAASNGAVGMLFTSPILVALASGRFGCFYDPLGLARFPSDRSYLALTTNTEDTFVQRVASWTESRAMEVPPGVSSVIPVRDSAAFESVLRSIPTPSVSTPR